MKRVFRFLFFVYAIIVLVPAFLLFLVFFFLAFSLLPGKKAPHFAHRYISRTGASILLGLLFVRVKFKNKEFIDPNQTYVFAANHQSQLDIPAFARSCTNTFRFLAKAELTKVPVLGYIIRKLYISVKRSDKADRVKSMENMMASLRENISVFICVEGTRNRSDRPLLDFKDGAFRLAIESQLPLAVLTVLDSKNLLPANENFQLSPGVMHCEWSRPIETKGMTLDNLPRLREMAKSYMLESLRRKEG
jgi:1-acyl-sn-glycerol-3-phosphate acyltransferase